PGTWNETLKVLDFGLAKLTSAPHLSIDELKGSQRRIVAVGTPEYICPEQIRGNEVDHRGDIYSVGVVLYEMLTGRRPFDADSNPELFELHTRAAPPAFADVGIADVEPTVEQVVGRCLFKYPSERPQSARELAELFEAALGNELSENDVLLLESQRSVESFPSVRAVIAAAKLPFTEVYNYQAWMPEKIAIIKLRGFLDELRGDVVESQPGLVRIRFKVEVEPPPPPPPPKMLVWLGLAEKPATPIPPDRVSLDIYLEKKDPEQPNLLSITAILDPGEDSNLVRRKKWKQFCDLIGDALARYLIAEKVSAT
ncbi:MAG TPA: protein kinase, partial [Gemmatales bacterium]|nr:protein kinase [Gemmatales bacterium]